MTRLVKARSPWRLVLSRSCVIFSSLSAVTLAASSSSVWPSSKMATERATISTLLACETVTPLPAPSPSISEASRRGSPRIVSMRSSSCSSLSSEVVAPSPMAHVADAEVWHEPRDPCGVDFDYFLEFFSALLRDLRCKVGVYPMSDTSAVRSVYIL